MTMNSDEARRTIESLNAVGSPVERQVRPRAMWSSGLQCGWIAWRVVNDGHLALDLPDDNCCDMRGAIKAAEVLCPLVWRIDTYAGGKPDTIYAIHKGKWAAYDANSSIAKALRSAA